MKMVSITSIVYVIFLSLCTYIYLHIHACRHICMCVWSCFVACLTSCGWQLKTEQLSYSVCFQRKKIHEAKIPWLHRKQADRPFSHRIERSWVGPVPWHAAGTGGRVDTACRKGLGLDRDMPTIQPSWSSTFLCSLTCERTRSAFWGCFKMTHGIHVKGPLGDHKTLPPPYSPKGFHIADKASSVPNSLSVRKSS
jgi:hypothetical protein